MSGSLTGPFPILTTQKGASVLADACNPAGSPADRRAGRDALAALQICARHTDAADEIGMAPMQSPRLADGGD